MCAGVENAWNARRYYDPAGPENNTTLPHTHMCGCVLFYSHQSASHARENRIDRRPPTMFDLSTFFSSFRQESAHGWSVRECVGRRHLRCLVSFMISYRH